MSDWAFTADGDNGFDVKLVDGAVDLAPGIDTAVYLSLFQAPYWGDALEAVARSGAGLTDVRGPLTNQVRLDIIEKTKRALSWMVSEGVVGRVSVSSVITSPSTVAITIRVHEPDKEARYELTWRQLEASA